jgi:DNA-binding XRE family transcriptional regulator
MSAQFIEKDGVPEFAVLPFAEYEKLMEIAEDKIDAADVLAYREAEEETFPEEVLNELLDGANPIKVYRKYRGMTQTELAQVIDMSLPYIAKLEAGDRMGRVDVLIKIAEVLRVDLDQIIT